MIFTVLLSLFFILFFAVFGWIIFAAFTKRGRNFTFGGEILKTYDGGESNLKKLIHTIKVHAIDCDDTRKIGLEVNGSRFAEHEMIPLVLTVEDAKKLINSLDEAIEYQ